MTESRLRAQHFVCSSANVQFGRKSRLPQRRLRRDPLRRRDPVSIVEVVMIVAVEAARHEGWDGIRVRLDPIRARRDPIRALRVPTRAPRSVTGHLGAIPPAAAMIEDVVAVHSGIDNGPVLSSDRWMDRGYCRRDVQRKERGAYSPGASRYDREKAHSSFQVSAR